MYQISAHLTKNVNSLMEIELAVGRTEESRDRMARGSIYFDYRNRRRAANEYVRRILESVPLEHCGATSSNTSTCTRRETRHG